MKNVRSVENTNPVTGEVSINKLFDTTLVSINKNWTGTTPNGKEYHIGNIKTPQGNMSCRVPLSIEVSVGDEVTVSATKLDTITALSVIGLATGGTTANANFFDSISEKAPVAPVKTKAAEVEEVNPF